jgi:hypothetical protein
VGRREVGVVLFSVILSERLRLDNAHWHAAHGKRRSPNRKDWKLAAGESEYGRTHRQGGAADVNDAPRKGPALSANWLLFGS